MLDTFLKICKEYGIYSIILFLVVISPVFTYFVLYPPSFIADHEYYVEFLAILIFSSCLFVVIYLSSLVFSTKIIKGKIYTWANLNDVGEKNKFLVITNTEITSIFMLFLTLIIILCHNIRHKIEFPIELTIPLIVIVIYICCSIICCIRLFNKYKE